MAGRASCCEYHSEWGPKMPRWRSHNGSRGCSRPVPARRWPLLDVTVVVPARNAESILPECLNSVQRERPRELIVVDGCSADRTAEIAREYGAIVVSDEGRGLPVARELGARRATSRRVALVDADVVVPHGALASLLGEFEAGGYTGLQAGLQSVGGPGYWGRALAHHHRTGPSRRWFGVVATIFECE